jgi:hypothetical protein
MAGEQKTRPFGYLKALESGEMQLFVYPIDFVEFCQLIASLNDYTQHQVKTP